MTDPRELLDKMQARCDAATEGPWEWRNSNGNPMLLSRAKGLYLVMGFRRMGMQGAQPLFRDRKNPALAEEAGKENLYSFPDAAFIAAARTDLPRLIAAVEAVLEEHAPQDVDVLVGDCATEDCDCEECTLTPVMVCAHCYEIGEAVSQYVYERGGIEFVAYPCPTVAAIHAALIGDNDE